MGVRCNRSIKQTLHSMLEFGLDVHANRTTVQFSEPVSSDGNSAKVQGHG